MRMACTQAGTQEQGHRRQAGEMRPVAAKENEHHHEGVSLPAVEAGQRPMVCLALREGHPDS